MGDDDEVMRVLAACENCQSIYAARQWPDGDIQAIGSDGCDCGSTDFVLVDESDDTSDDGTVGRTNAE
ncbi:hypothetical protein OB955_01110 [Halobacteria archaeon AArc-m2/3/4]|uniref:Uncharacterized protein n=1 Tax=Natronoglomus mannanivorans TaxID=2979990 RepID=A0AAP3E0K3_9EURY|nr:hypothetical protein [Halobacteria archaeon AArc-xg1-1]MCU4971339.1 hypothetical protein [Halobacteria archaeon AArc-m2/3/4]